MRRAAAARATYEFGDFRLDPGRRRFEKVDGTEVALGAKAFDALVHLVEHAGEPVSRKALTVALWPEAVVEENNLTQAISALRRALGSGYIVTLPGRGYQFVCEVRVTSDGVLPETRPVAADAEAELQPAAGASPGASSGEGGSSLPLARSQRSAEAPELERPPEPPVHSRSARRRVGSFPAAAIAAVVLAVTAVAWLYRHAGTSEQTPRGAVQEEVAQPATLLVLPFESLSADPDRRYFSDSLTDELIVSLQRLTGLRVIGRTTSFAYRDSEGSVREIAAELGVEYVFEASVGQDGERLHVRGQLSDASGFGVWPYTYEGPRASIFDVREEIISGIAEKLSTTLGLDETQHGVGTDSFEAYQLYLEARAQSVRGEFPARLVRTSELLDRALRIDSEFATAWMLKSAVHSVSSQNAPPERRTAELAAAEDAALEAVRLAPDQGDGYAARALMLGVRGDWHGAERDYRRARSLGLADIPHYATLVLSAGRLEQGRRVLEEHLEIDPLNGDQLGFLMAAHEMLGDRSAADQIQRRGNDLFEEWVFGASASTWIRLGRGESELISEHADQMRPLFSVFADLIDEPEAARAEVRRAASAQEYQRPYRLATLAMWAAYLDDHESALQLLRSATHGGSAVLMYVAWLPVFEDVRQLPEFKDLLIDIGLVDYWRTAGWPDVCQPLGANSFDCR